MRSSISARPTSLRARVIQRSSRSARPGSTITTTTRPRDAQEQGFRAHIAAARETGLPLVIHSREADDDTARILEEETGKGAFPAVLHCFTGGRDLAMRGVALGHYVSFTGILTFKNSQDLRDIAADAAGGPDSGRDRRAVSRARSVSRQTQRAGLCGRNREGAGADARRLRGRDRAPDHGEFLPAVLQSAARDLPARHDADVHHSRLRIVRRRAAAGARLGRLRSEQSEEPPPPLLAAGRAPRATRRQDQRADRYLAGSARAVARRRMSNGSTPCSITHEHADHTHGIDDLRPLFIHRRRRIDVYLDEPTSRIAACAIRLLLREPARQRISADRHRASARRRHSR